MALCLRVSWMEGRRVEEDCFSTASSLMSAMMAIFSSDLMH